MTLPPKPLALLALCLGAPLALSQTTTSTSATDTQQRIQSVESCLTAAVLIKGTPPACTTLAQRMAQLHIPGVSIAVVHHGAIEWARGYGFVSIGGSSINPETLFQAGSISKPVAAMAALHLVQQGKLSLDANVNTELKSWKVPDSPAAPGAVVTLRELLTHTAGFTVHGFPGYAATDPVPTLLQVLNGEKPANTPAIRLESVPGTKWNYSGGGYTVMQQLLIDVSGKPFADLLHDTVLAPIGMVHSTYQQPLPANLRSNAATPYTGDGKPIPGGAHTYPELAAAGLWTTPSDLARYILENQLSLQGKANHVLSPESTRQMLTPGKGNWGLGLEMGGTASNPYFSHGGVNEGFESLFAAYEQGGDGAVIMTNAQGGSQIASELMASIALAYHWPDFQPVIRTAIKVDPAILARYVGTYEPAPNFDFTFVLQGNQLILNAPGQSDLKIFPESQTKFFLTVTNLEMEFFPAEKDQPGYVILHQNGQDHKAPKTK